ncbi:MAG: lysophospholipase [Oscillospiraceae bacterium]|nr:lysophospholipase [Oscillospiraceae bacterium]
MAAETVIMRDGARIHAQIHEPAGTAVRAVVQLIHGFGEHSGRYAELAGRFTANGCVFAVHDQRGHGLTPGKRGVAPRYDSLLDDADQMCDLIEARYPGVPAVLYGHSMGGNIALNYLLHRSQARHVCAVIGSPWLRLHKPYPGVTRLAARLLGKASPALVTTGKLLLELLTRDQEIVKATAADKLYHTKLSFRLFTEITLRGESAIAGADKITLPTLMLRAGQDRVVSPQAIEELASAAAAVTLLSYPELYHELHNELERETVFNDTMEFIARYL